MMDKSDYGEFAMKVELAETLYGLDLEERFIVLVLLSNLDTLDGFEYRCNFTFKRISEISGIPVHRVTKILYRLNRANIIDVCFWGRGSAYRFKFRPVLNGDVYGNVVKPGDNK